MENINSITIRTSSIQFLETLSILDNSKNIETIKSRIEFLESVTVRLRNLTSDPDYLYFTQMAIDDYSVRYFNRTLSETDISRLSGPEYFDLELYSINSLINGLKRFFEEQMEEVDAIKNSSSKDRRISKIIHNILLVKNFMQMKYSESKSFQMGIEEIEKLTKKIKEIHETI